MRKLEKWSYIYDVHKNVSPSLPLPAKMNNRFIVEKH